MGSGNSKEQQQEEFEKKQEAPRLSLVDPRIRDEYENAVSALVNRKEEWEALYFKNREINYVEFEDAYKRCGVECDPNYMSIPEDKVDDSPCTKVCVDQVHEKVINKVIDYVEKANDECTECVVRCDSKFTKEEMEDIESDENFSWNDNTIVKNRAERLKCYKTCMDVKYEGQTKLCAYVLELVRNVHYEKS